VSYSESLRQQAQWIREALDPKTPEPQRITMDDIDVDELEAAADHINRLRAALELIAGSTTDKLQRMQAAAALDNIGPSLTWTDDCQRE
jgi:hypothetical protein